MADSKEEGGWSDPKDLKSDPQVQEYANKVGEIIITSDQYN